jgi:hypothetical protein
LQELGGPVTVAMDPDDELAAGEPAVLRNGTGETAGEFGAA